MTEATAQTSPSSQAQQTPLGSILYRNVDYGRQHQWGILYRARERIRKYRQNALYHSILKEFNADGRYMHTVIEERVRRALRHKHIHLPCIGSEIAFATRAFIRDGIKKGIIKEEFITAPGMNLPKTYWITRPKSLESRITNSAVIAACFLGGALLVGGTIYVWTGGRTTTSSPPTQEQQAQQALKEVKEYDDLYSRVQALADADKSGGELSFEEKVTLWNKMGYQGPFPKDAVENPFPQPSKADLEKALMHYQNQQK